LAHVVHSTAKHVGLQLAVGVEQGVLELGTHFFINLMCMRHLRKAGCAPAAAGVSLRGGLKASCTQCRASGHIRTAESSDALLARDTSAALTDEFRLASAKVRRIGIGLTNVYQECLPREMLNQIRPRRFLHRHGASYFARNQNKEGDSKFFFDAH
jgi:hypothetical protein